MTQSAQVAGDGSSQSLQVAGGGGVSQSVPANGGGTDGASAAAAGHKSADEMLDELLEDFNKDEKEPAAVAVKSVRAPEGAGAGTAAGLSPEQRRCNAAEAMRAGRPVVPAALPAENAAGAAPAASAAPASAAPAASAAKGALVPVADAGQRPGFLPRVDGRGQAGHQGGDDRADHGGSSNPSRWDGLQGGEGRGNDQGQGQEVDQRAQAGGGRLLGLLALPPGSQVDSTLALRPPVSSSSTDRSASSTEKRVSSTSVSGGSLLERGGEDEDQERPPLPRKHLRRDGQHGCAEPLHQCEGPGSRALALHDGVCGDSRALALHDRVCGDSRAEDFQQSWALAPQEGACGGDRALVLQDGDCADDRALALRGEARGDDRALALHGEARDDDWALALHGEVRGGDRALAQCEDSDGCGDDQAEVHGRAQHPCVCLLPDGWGSKKVETHCLDFGGDDGEGITVEGAAAFDFEGVFGLPGLHKKHPNSRYRRGADEFGFS